MQQIDIVKDTATLENTIIDNNTYIVFWFSAGGIGKQIAFSNFNSARRHARHMEQDGYFSTMKVIPAA